MYVPAQPPMPPRRPPQGLSGPSLEAVASAQVERAPYRGPSHTIEVMRSFVTKDRTAPETRAVAEDNVRELYGKDKLSEAAAHYYATCRAIRYLNDPSSVEHVKDFAQVMKTKQADCGSQTAFLSSLLAATGIGQQRYTTVGFQPGAISHVFVRFKDPRGSGRMVVLDPVAGPTTATMLTRIRNVEDHEGI